MRHTHAHTDTLVSNTTRYARFFGFEEQGQQQQQQQPAPRPACSPPSSCCALSHCSTQPAAPETWWESRQQTAYQPVTVNKQAAQALPFFAMQPHDPRTRSQATLLTQGRLLRAEWKFDVPQGACASFPFFTGSCTGQKRAGRKHRPQLPELGTKRFQPHTYCLLQGGQSMNLSPCDGQTETLCWTAFSLSHTTPSSQPKLWRTNHLHTIHNHYKHTTAFQAFYT